MRLLRVHNLKVAGSTPASGFSYDTIEKKGSFPVVLFFALFGCPFSGFGVPSAAILLPCALLGGPRGP